MTSVRRDISAAKAKAASGIKPAGPRADDPGYLEQEAEKRTRHEQTLRLRESRLAREADIRAGQKGGS